MKSIISKLLWWLNASASGKFSEDSDEDPFEEFPTDEKHEEEYDEDLDDFFQEPESEDLKDDVDADPLAIEEPSIPEQSLESIKEEAAKFVEANPDIKNITKVKHANTRDVDTSFNIETFTTIDNLIDVIFSRPNNSTMRYCDSSYTNDVRFSGTNSMEEAIRLLKNGYLDILDTVMKKVSSKTLKYKMSESKRNLPENFLVGYTPNVPNALMGLPNSMIVRRNNSIPNKTLHITYVMCCDCSYSPDFLREAGITLLALINILEKKRIKVCLDVCIDAGTNFDRDWVGYAMLRAKNYGEQLNFPKLCFIIGHPSMFRRIGFKWLETVPWDIPEEFSAGYGRPPSDLHNQKLGELTNTVVISTYDIQITCGNVINNLIDLVNSRC